MRKGLISTFIAALIGLILLPAAYDHFGAGAQAARAIIVSSAQIKADCGEINHLIVVPWKLSVEDSDASGNLAIVYWFECKGSIASAEAQFHHNGGIWIVDSATAIANGKRYSLLPAQ